MMAPEGFSPQVAACATLWGTLLLAFAAPAHAQDPPPDVSVTAEPDDPCQYWGTYEFFYFAEEETVAACLQAGEDPRARVDELGRTPLHNAARAWKASAIRDLLAVGVDIDARDWLGRTPLHDAADIHRPTEPDATDARVRLVPLSARGGPVVEALLEGGADVNARDSRGNTPLHISWRDPTYDWLTRDMGRSMDGVAAVLLESGADPSALNDRDEPASPGDCGNWHRRGFAVAAVPQSLHGMPMVPPFTPVLADYAQCVAAGADMEARDAGGYTVLHNAVAVGDTSAITLLLGAGAETDVRARDGTTPLHTAAQAGRTAVATMLLRRRADVNVTDHDGTTPLHVAARNAKLAMVNVLLEAGADANVVDVHGTSLHGPRNGADRLAIVDALLEAGLDVNLRGPESDRPMLSEAFSGISQGFETQLARRFLQRGADPNARSQTGRTALHEAFLEGPEVFRMLLDAGADPTSVDNWGNSPLHSVAGFSDHAGVIPMLVEVGADVSLLNHDGRAPLHLAITRHTESVARVVELLEAGADPSMPTGSGDTPLHLAAGATRWPDSATFAVVELLVAAGADVNALNGRRETPAESAWLADRSAVVDRLLELGAEPVALVDGPADPGADTVSPGVEPGESDRGTRPGTLLCDWNAGDYANYRSPFKFPAESVAGCLSAGTGLTVSNRYGEPLIFWLPAGDLDVLALLLDAGADVNARNDYGFTLLHQVARFWRGDTAYSLPAARALLQAGADPDASGRGERTPLHAVAEAPSGGEEPAVPGMLSLLVEAGADVNARTESGQTALHLALDNPNAAVRLLELGADPAARNDSARVADPASCENFGTRSFFALSIGDSVAECIESVTQPGGRVSLQSALQLAAATARDPGVIHALLEAGASIDERDGTPLHKAAATGTPAVIRLLLEAGANPHGRVEDRTPLHLAAGNRDPGAVAVLLDAGADIHARVSGYETALHTAARNENPQVARVLLDAGADVDARDGGGRTPLLVAALENSNPDVLSVLIGAGADLEARARPAFGPRLRGLTPMYMAALSGTPEVVTVLAEAGARVDAERAELRPETPFISGVSRSGLRTYGDLGHNSPLHLAALFNNKPGVLVALVRAGADLELRNRMGQTALHIAARHNPRAFPALLELGADPDAVDDDGKTPMDYARLNKNLHGLPEVRRLLIGGVEGARR